MRMAVMDIGKMWLTVADRCVDMAMRVGFFLWYLIIVCMLVMFVMHMPMCMFERFMRVGVRMRFSQVTIANMPSITRRLVFS